jgi:hypothetical protein
MFTHVVSFADVVSGFPCRVAGAAGHKQVADHFMNFGEPSNIVVDASAWSPYPRGSKFITFGFCWEIEYLRFV